uniref:RING finger and transmembrane domain-containing protein 2-like n=1 Tax=Rhizophora mucronata TaxID=61149 RepID=A0A2P2LP20_RHIMU
MLPFYYGVNTSSVKIVYPNGLREKGHVPYAGLWLDLQILDLLVMVQQAYSSRYFKAFVKKTEIFCSSSKHLPKYTISGSSYRLRYLC